MFLLNTYFQIGVETVVLHKIMFAILILLSSQQGDHIFAKSDTARTFFVVHKMHICLKICIVHTSSGNSSEYAVNQLC